MANHYVDIGTIGAWNTRDGATSGACWYGLTGLQNAFDHCTEGDVCYVKGTGNANVFYSVPYDADNDTTLTNGEEVTWDSGAWVDGTFTGIVHIISTTATSPGTVEIELSAGNTTAPADGDVIKGTTSGGTITAHTTIAKKGLDIDTNSGTRANGWIKFIGVNSSWAVDGTRATVTGNDLAGVNIFSFNGKAMLWFENIEGCHTGAGTKHGWNFVTANSALVAINCSAHSCSGSGFYLSYCVYSIFIRCSSYSNTQYGSSSDSTSNKFFFCSFTNNTLTGMYSSGGLVFGCISHGNTQAGCYTYSNSGVGIINSVFDSNGFDGVTISNSSVLYGPPLIGLRITNQSVAGKSGLNLQGYQCVVGWCYFEANTDDISDHTIAAFGPIPIENGTTTTNLDSESQDDTNEGYAQAVANNNFATGYVDGTDPLLRRVAITIPWI